MKRILIVVVALMLIAGYAQGASKFYWATGLTGGGAALDGIDGAGLAAGDAAVVVVAAGTPALYFYALQESGTAESSPDVISPNSNAGTKRWHLAGQTAASLTISKVSGQPSTSLLYEATTTETNGVGWKGPASRASDLYLQFADADPAANQIMVFPAPTTGTSTGVWTTYGQFGALNLVTTGAIHGGIEIIADDTSMEASQCYGSFNDTNGTETITLPTAVVGMNLCIYSNDATVKTIDPYSSEVIELNGTALTGGYAIKSPGAAGNFICLICRSTGVWTTLGQSGVWVTNGS